MYAAFADAAVSAETGVDVCRDDLCAGGVDALDRRAEGIFDLSAEAGAEDAVEHGGKAVEVQRVKTLMYWNAE